MPGIAHATGGGASLRYGGGGQGTVIFDGRLHASKGFRCNDCHSELFETRKVAHIKMADHFTDKACFKCHNNNNNTDKNTASRDCATCHRKVASSDLSSTDAMAGIIVTPMADEKEKKTLLSGKLGATRQSQACLSCHGAPTPPKPVTERGKTLNLHVDMADYRHGTHANIACTTCHVGTKGAESFLAPPHAVTPPSNATCASCHNVGLAHEIKAFGQSTHAQKLKDKISCANCHNPHAQPKKPALIAYTSMAALYNAECLACHDNPARLRELGAKDIRIGDAASAHAFLTKWQAHSKTVLCVECHTPVADPDSHLVMDKKRALRDCAVCHTTGKSLIIERANLHAGGATVFAASYFPPVRVDPRLDTWGGIALAAAVALLILHALGRLVTRRRHPAKPLVSEYVYPGFVRVSHWINAGLFIVLGITGLAVRFQGIPLAPGLEWAIRLHNIAGVLLALNFALFVVTGIVTGDIRQYLPSLDGLGGRMARQAHYYCIGIFRGEAKPFAVTRQRRFNPLQQGTYLLVFLVGMSVLIASGVLLLLPDSVTNGIAPRQALVALHYLLVIGFALFFAGHIYLSTTGEMPASLVRGMVTGLHEHSPDDASQMKGVPDAATEAPEDKKKASM
jgi:thiosulfate reductase cytochrome b subunit